jgi:hypothetical protein
MQCNAVLIDVPSLQNAQFEKPRISRAFSALQLQLHCMALRQRPHCSSSFPQHLENPYRKKG